jgi:hypothetical protein
VGIRIPYTEEVKFMTLDFASQMKLFSAEIRVKGSESFHSGMIHQQPRQSRWHGWHYFDVP